MEDSAEAALYHSGQAGRPKVPACFFFCCTRSRLKIETGRARFRETGKTDARKRPTSAASPQRSLLKAESILAATMESLLRSPMKLVLLTGT